jgi:DNA-binding MarR family transcriptional regulator
MVSLRLRGRPVDYGVLDTLAGYAIRRALLAIGESFDADLTCEGMTIHRFSALTLIARNPGITRSILAQILGVAKPRATMVVLDLQKMGLVENRPINGDLRLIGLYLNAKGRRRYSRIERRMREHDQLATARLTAEERATLLRLLAKFGPDDDDGGTCDIGVLA